jgi:hypothetical protein
MEEQVRKLEKTIEDVKKEEHRELDNERDIVTQLQK